MSSFEQPLDDDDIHISEELIGRLHGATENAVLELVGAFQANRRANLAMHCYRKSHLRQTGLTIARTCDLSTLVHVCGPLRGEAIFAQSRGHSNRPRRASARRRSAITLACSAGGAHPPLSDVDEKANCEELVLV
jgi:hypothetical protein